MLKLPQPRLRVETSCPDSLYGRTLSNVHRQTLSTYAIINSGHVEWVWVSPINRHNACIQSGVSPD